MRKLLLVLSVLCFVNFAHAQEVRRNCNSEYAFELTSSDEFASNRDKFVTFSWNLSNTKDYKSGNVKIEIVPILDCWEELEGSRFRDLITLPLKEVKGSMKVSHVKMRAKCFKWRIVFNATSCKETTDWEYYSFID